MKKLPPAKQKQLIGVLVGTVVLICLVYFLLISPQNSKNARLSGQIGQESNRLKEFRDAILKKASTVTNLASWDEQLQHAEGDVASGDLYAWTYDLVRRFKVGYPKLDISNPGQPTAGNCDLIADFPYKQIRFSLAGTGHYHDLGRFVADFENKYPHCRVLNLTAEPELEDKGTNAAGGGEKLNFRMEIVALVKPNR
jgi:Tfp pilus assembly protein PilO